jgi:polyphosphate glucokinase
LPTKKTSAARTAPSASKRAQAKRATRASDKDRVKAKDLPCVLTVDIGGSKIKFLASGQTEPRSIKSGKEISPAKMVSEVKRLSKGWKYTAVSLGYPGLVSASGPVAEPGNLGPGWVGFDYGAAFGCPVRIVNDAAMQALGSYDGGRMLFLGFGTGVGSVLIVQHTVIPLELGELRAGDKTFSETFGRRAFEKAGEKRWRERVLETIPSLQRAFLADYVVIGGGNSKYLLEPLPPNVRLGHNLTAFRGGYRLWGIDEMPSWQVDSPDAKTPGRLGNWRLL